MKKQTSKGKEAEKEAAPPQSPPPYSSPSFFDIQSASSSSSSTSNSSNPNIVAEPRKLKLIVVGDYMEGEKTKLLHKYIHAEDMPKDKIFGKLDISSKLDIYLHKITLNDGKIIKVELWDTSGKEENKKLRPLEYPATDIVVFLYSDVHKESYGNILSLWKSEIETHCPNALRVLIASKKPVETQQDEFSCEALKHLAEQIGAVAYFECFIETGEQIEEAFRFAIAKRIELSQAQLASVQPLIDALETYADKRDGKKSEDHDGYQHFWKGTFGGKPCQVKVQVARDLVQDLKSNGPNLQRKFSQDEIDTLLKGDLGKEVEKYPDIVDRIKQNGPAAPVASTAQRRPSQP